MFMIFTAEILESQAAPVDMAKEQILPVLYFNWLDHILLHQYRYRGKMV